MSPDDKNWSQKREAAAEGLDNDDATFTKIVQSMTSGDIDGSIRETVGFIKRLFTDETPEDPEAISNIFKDEMIIAVYRINFFEKLRHPVVDDEQLEHLYDRTIELWGESPTEPIGRWVEWNLWVTRHRRRNSISLTELFNDEKSVDDIRRQWVERHQAREERRKLQKIDNYDQYDALEEVPPSLRNVLFSPFIENEDDLPDVEVAPDSADAVSDTDDSTEKNLETE